MRKALTMLFHNDDAVTAVEYAVLIGLVLVIILSAIGTVGIGTFNLFQTADSQMNTHGI